MAEGTRDRMIDAAIDALRRDGVAGMSFTDLLIASGAARGAIYHHFPGGKSELVVEAVTRNAGDVRGRLVDLPHGSPRLIVDEFVDLIRPVVQQSSAGSGCAVAAAAMASCDQRDYESLQQAAANAITLWVGVLRERLHAAGIDETEAADLASLLVTTLEGAHVLARAKGRIDPFDQAARALVALVANRYPD
jgi:AcrR family transcriptional regulator